MLQAACKAAASRGREGAAVKTNPKGELAMLTTKLSKKLVAILVALVAVAAGSVAYAAIPAADGNQQGAPGQPGISLYANVAQNGSLASGTAVSVEKAGQGTYRVYFARAVAQCAPVAETGAFEGASASWGAIFTTYLSSGLPTGEVMVFGSTPDGSPVDGSFHLIVACRTTTRPASGDTPEAGIKSPRRT